jgi:hypothetical protein
MDTGTKIYQVDKHKQLIPLNNSMVNFSCFFEVKSKNSKPFNIGIAEQSSMDKPNQCKAVQDGYINGQIESDGQLKTYFLILKSTEPCECEVRIVLKPKDATTPPTTSPSQSGANPGGMSTPLESSREQSEIAKKTSYFTPKYIGAISAAFIVMYLVYRYRKEIFGKWADRDTRFGLAPSFSSTSF